MIEKSESHQSVHEEIKIRGFTPLTSSSRKKLDRKEKLRDLIKKKFGKDLKKIQEKCNDEHLLINLVFYIIESDEKGRSKTDLDNLQKLLFDVLSINMLNGQEMLPGVGVMKNDSQIYEIRCKKIMVHDMNEEGIDLRISIMPKRES